MLSDVSENVLDLAGRYICFSLGKEKFAIPLLQVKEVIGNIEVTPIPQSPNYFKGIMNLRGQVISIIDLSTKLKIPKSADTKETTIVILDMEQMSLGIIVDSVECVEFFNGNDISHSNEFDSTLKTNILGVAKKAGSMTLLLDLKGVGRKYVPYFSSGCFEGCLNIFRDARLL